jgi:hypothetical protein
MTEHSSIDDCKYAIKKDDFIKFKEIVCYLAEYGDFRVTDWLTIIRIIIRKRRGTYLSWFLNHFKTYPWFQSVMSSDVVESRQKGVLSHAIRMGTGSLDMVKRLLPFTGVHDISYTIENYVSPLAYTISCDYLSHSEMEQISYLLIDYGARLSMVTNVYGLSSDRLYALLRYQKKRNARRAACTAAIAALSRVFRVGGAPRDFTQHLLRNFVWPLRNNDDWLTPGKQQRKKNKRVP